MPFCTGYNVCLCGISRTCARLALELLTTAHPNSTRETNILLSRLGQQLAGNATAQEGI